MTLKAKAPPEYDGKKEIRNWLAMMEAQFRFHRTPAHQQVDFAILHLSERVALNWRLRSNQLQQARARYLAHPASAATAGPPPDPAVWQTFRDEMIKMYGPADPIEKARRDLDKLVQGRGSVEAYYKKFLELCAQIAEDPQQTLSEGEMIHSFKKGLDSSILRDVMVNHGSHKFSTLTELAELAIAIEENVKTLKAMDKDLLPKDMGQTSKSKPQKRKKAQKSSENQLKGVPTLTAEERKTLSEEGKCFICKEKGHRFFECPKNPKAKGKNSDSSKKAKKGQEN